MDITQIIITIAICIGALIVLWAIIGGIILAIGRRSAKKMFNDFDRRTNLNDRW